MVITRGYDRLVNLSDAVIAIAVTLLILPLVDDVGRLGTQSPADFLADQGLQLFLFALSFVVIARFWLLHHQIYRNIDGYTLPLIWVNFAWLLSIVFLPFPTELLGRGSSIDRTAASLYIGTMVVTSLTSLVQMALIIRRPEMQIEAVRDTLRLTPSVVSTVTMAVALLLALTIPGAGVYPLLLLILGGRVERLIVRRQNRRAVANAG
ncbi:TMEM175 family protein [Subtercola boreus]|uniref:DUF1211 domain-containing membrane protein n=1 Tax=Subtercola boreus TaxID=120213 RepID=A0A3E0W7F0_9MICO|nr:TMEM175 family protein [Subtercola boreus]RFA17939.1 hypothetical protein B7R24_14825 [Subtercola boreus]RFA18321.1 hypothetical protein B7R23_14860 [Subtercola boreus]RFA24851.1 hypothetical protein B7R25_14855 [Subtercola boreus]